MERLNLMMERRGQTNGDVGQNENAGGGRRRRRRGAQGDGGGGAEGRRRAQSQGGHQAERRETDGGAGGMIWRSRGVGGEPGRGGNRGAGREGRDGRGRGRGGGGGGAADAGGQRGGGRQGGGGGGGGGGGWGRGGNGEQGAAGRGGGGGWGRGGNGEQGAAGRGGGGGGWGRGGNGEQGAAGRGGGGGVRRGGHSEDRRGGRRDGGGDRQQRNGGGAHSTGRDGAPRGHGLGYKKLEELSRKDPSEVSITLSSHRGLQEALGETTMRKDLVELLCKVLSIAFKSRTDRSSLLHLASIIKESAFFRNRLLYYLVGIGMESDPVRRAQYPEHLGNILAILSEVLSMFPASSVQVGSLLLTQLQSAVSTLKAAGVVIRRQTEESMETVQDLIKHLQERSREGTLRSDKDTYALLGDNPGEEDLEDFRTIPIYPTPEEFHQDRKPFLRPNLTSKRYTNTHLYLDTHFRLLREDFVRPLRDGIQQLLRSQAGGGGNNTPLKAKHFDDIRVYFDTKLVVPKCTTTGLAYIVQFDVQPLQFVRWQNSKRLIFGSLVCLSCDNFRSFLLATVSDRDPNELQRGQVQITFTEESRYKLARIEKNQLFLMVETSAYFEAYRYVLDGLQEQDEDRLPFQRYIVECNPDVHHPAYVRKVDTLDLKHVANPDFKDHMKPFCCLEEEAWPRKEELGLDESQMKAFQLALTKELAIIQGPPGTGKTYVGLKIAQALLTNQCLWRNPTDKSPMLVVCYTNHALDQFLEGIHKFLQDGIVRVGGRSNSEVLKRFNMRELTRSTGFRNSLPSHLHQAHNRIFGELCDVEREMESQGRMLECSLKGVLHERALGKFIWERHWDGLHQTPGLQPEHGFARRREKRPSRIMEWLGLGSTVFLQRETEYVNGNEDVAAEEPMELDEEDLIEIAEEADLIEAERIIDDNTDPRGGRDGRRKEEMEEAVREMEEHMLAMNLDEAEIKAEQSEEGWEIQRAQKRKMRGKIRNELGKSTTMTEREEITILDIWSLSLTDRWRLYRLWVARYRVDLTNKILESEEEYQNAVDRLADVKRHQSLFLLKEATVIGMTTTGAAKYRKVLQAVRPRLVIVEEAAEVLEAHTITTLSEACQHLILIGDHQQLRPSATVYELAKNFNLEMSMFERLVKMGLPYVRLNYQHRMRPEIARLLTPHIYSELENHPSVFEYDNIKGLNTNLFFMEHNHLEEEIRDGKSHQNKYEAMFVVALCRYLLLQDYKPEQITILTTYTGQFNCLRKLMPASEFQGVRVHVVDKYQGEENDIVLLSLVRSNRQGKVGFLNIPNRVCVALSRAKKGLYCIGNSTMLGKVQLWSNIFNTLREKDQVGKALTLCCQNHPAREVKVYCADDFKQSPEGGCTQPCNFRLDCGHVCSRVCHPYDPEHKKYKCPKRCEKPLCEQGHKCTLVCFKKCPKECPVKVEKIVPQCQHSQMVPCHQDPATFRCQEPCKKMLPCGHPCDSSCGEPCTLKCRAKVTLHLLCGHSQEDECFYKTCPGEVECRAPCEHQLLCGHACRGTCGKCYQGRFHFPCVHQCERLLICSHKCNQPCTSNCPPCQRPCENFCFHSKCMKPCGQPCAPCIEPCAWQCAHRSCSKLCHEPCDRPPCTQPCAKTLACGHPCIGLCGDKCPNMCRICNHDEVTEIFFGTEDDPEARFIQLEDCGHIIEHTAMDTYMGMDDNQQPTEGEEVAIKLKQCPKCRTPIRKNLRYGSHINSSLAQIELVKMKINGDQAVIKEHRRTLKQQWRDNLVTNEMDQQPTFMNIKAQLERSYLTSNDLWVVENKMDFLVRIAKLEKIHKENMLYSQSFTLEKYLSQFQRWLSRSYLKFTDQQVHDLQRELQRITLLTEINVRCDMAYKRGQSTNIQSEVQRIRQVLEKCGQFTERDQDRVKDDMKELDRKLPPSGLGITEKEREMIVSAMKMKPGHWYKCPNGHVYLITECGGAMEERQCPDCNATIGGASHTLASGNQVASEMDGSQHPAWSETNNLLNFDQLDL